MDTTPTQRRVCIVGASLAANKGAAAMLESVIAVLPTVAGPCRFAVLSTYPTEDAERFRDRADVDVVDLSPLRLAALEIPVALVTAVLRRLRLPTGWLTRTPACRAISRSDLVVDVAGISFADGRGLPILVYNVMMTGLGVLLGVPTVKAAQALGPFERRATRFAGRLVLPRLRWIGARGAATRRNLDALGLTNVEDVADLAFSLPEASALPDDLAALLPADRRYAVVMPSAVVRKLATRDGLDYVAAVAELVHELRAATGLAIVMAPHSYRAGQPESRMNDGPVCREVGAALGGETGVVVVDEDLDAGSLRQLVHGGELLVTSRFHAMISGLATATPTVVVGWSHKYREVLAEFGLETYGLDHGALREPKRIVELAVRALDERDEIRQAIEQALPAVMDRSLANFRAMATVLGNEVAA